MSTFRIDGTRKTKTLNWKHKIFIFEIKQWHSHTPDHHDNRGKTDVRYFFKYENNNNNNNRIHNNNNNNNNSQQ